MATNNLKFLNAALQAASGVNAWPTDATSTDYAKRKNAAVAFSVEVDAAIPTEGGDGATVAQADLLRCICSSALLGRDIASAVSSDYAGVAAAINAQYQEIKGSLG